VKGQYLAIESVLTIGIGLVIATGTITIFTDYRDNVLDSGKDKQAEIIRSKIINSLNTIKKVDQGEKSVQLRERLGDSEYQIKMEDNLTIITNKDEYQFKLSDDRYSYSGFTDGGPVKLFKSGKQIEIRSQ